MSTVSEGLITIEEKLHGVLVRHAISALRITVGLIFLGFGVLKFFPGVSPAEGLSIKTIDLLTFGLIPWEIGIIAIAALECFIGICLLANRWMRLAVWLLAIEFIGILAPLVLLTGRLFSGPNNAPTLEGQYVLKDIILVAAGMAIAAGTFRGGRLIRDEPVAAGERTVQDVCDEHHISQSTHYEWRTAAHHGAMNALDEQTNATVDTHEPSNR